jgi:hypothetical protein
VSDLYAEAMRNLRELLDGAEPYHSHVYQYTRDELFRATVKRELRERKASKL